MYKFAQIKVIAININYHIINSKNMQEYTCKYLNEYVFTVTFIQFYKDNVNQIMKICSNLQHESMNIYYLLYTSIKKSISVVNSVSSFNLAEAA